MNDTELLLTEGNELDMDSIKDSRFFVKELVQGKEVIYYTRNPHKVKVMTFNNLRSAQNFIRRIESPKHKNRFSAWIDDKGAGEQVSVSIRFKNKYVVSPGQKRYDIEGKKLRMQLGDHPMPSVYFEEIDTTRKDNFELPDYVEYNQYIQNFINNKQFYKENDLFYRLGVLMYGPPGNGKTSYFRYMLANNVLPADATVIWTDYIPPSSMVKALKDAPGLKVFIFEELTSAVSSPRDLRQFLQFMDGEDTIENSIYFATTNHPEALPYNVIDRPGRFDKMIEVGNPDVTTRETILKQYFKDEFDENMIGDTYDMSTADIKEAFLLSKVQKLKFVDGIQKLRNHKQMVKQAFEKYKKIGF